MLGVIETFEKALGDADGFGGFCTSPNSGFGDELEMKGGVSTTGFGVSEGCERLKKDGSVNLLFTEDGVPTKTDDGSLERAFDDFVVDTVGLVCCGTKENGA